jgi:hypothetical protein
MVEIRYRYLKVRKNVGEIRVESIGNEGELKIKGQ